MNPYRATAALALVSGAALVVDTVTIAVLNRAFDPLDSILFLVGFAGVWLTGVAFALAVGERRPARSIVAFFALAAALGAISFAADAMGRHVFAASNKGLHGEWSFFSIGVCLLGLAAWAALRVRTPSPPTSSTTRSGGSARTSTTSSRSGPGR